MGLLKDKLAFITGASSGIGLACAESFAAEGANLILAARRSDRLKELADMLASKYSVKVKIIKLDVRDRKAVKEAISSLEEEWNDIDILINNAGLARGFNRLHEGSIDAWEEMIDTNVKGLLFVTRNILPRMVERMQGHIINIGSTAGHEVYPNGNVYCATKFAVNALTKAMKIELIDKNIRVSTVDPGMVQTEFSNVRFSGDDERAQKVYEGITPLTAEDIADAVLYCATRPAHVNIQEIILTPTAQGSSTQIFRKL